MTSANFGSYCINAPVDARLPGGGGNQLCGYHDVNQAQFGITNNVIQVQPQQEDVYDGVDLATNARLPRGVFVGGGVSLGRERTNNCFALDDLSLFPSTSPQTNAFCDIRPPLQPNIKALAVYPLPWGGLEASAAFQSLPGPQITATRTYTNAEIAPSLGRNLSAGANGTASLQLIAAGTMFGERLNQFDVRVSKTFRMVQGRRVRLSVDLYNVSDRRSSRRTIPTVRRGRIRRWSCSRAWSSRGPDPFSPGGCTD